MRKRKEIKIDEKTSFFAVELKFFKTNEVLQKIADLDIMNLDQVREKAELLLPYFTENLSVSQFQDFAISELLELGNAVLEVNSPFLKILEQLGIKQALIQQYSKLLESFKTQVSLRMLDSQDQEKATLEEMEVQLQDLN